jgi:hypothetical protein
MRVNGINIGTMASFVDITERKLAQKAPRKLRKIIIV